MVDLKKIASREGIAILYRDLDPPLHATYVVLNGRSPTITLSKELKNDPPLLRCVLAEELGYHFSNRSLGLGKAHSNFSDRKELTEEEYLARAYACRTLIPFNKLVQLLESGMRTNAELANHFGVTEEMIEFRLELIKPLECSTNF